MNETFEQLEKTLVKKYKSKDKRKKPVMKVSGKSVVRLQRLIVDKDKRLSSS